MDYSRLHDLLELPQHAEAPSVEDILRALPDHVCRVFSIISAAAVPGNGFYNVRIDADSVPIAAFAVGTGGEKEMFEPLLVGTGTYWYIAGHFVQ